MQTRNLQLPDGRLVTIEGGDAEVIAKFIANHYLGIGLVTNTFETETPLELPSMAFSNETQQPETRAHNAPVSNEEIPLPLPTLF